ncbi:putative RNA-directed DNA polymerase [Medicago truncatula]|uniref:Putative RNA-directed DNA polymerase n=1 Tax=Medicago truncatula TaxID=3880 RepID=A0A396HSE3_MEDTR|nr:putative RNA-directed DNA polymerase [Medicago truncatula]
MKMTLISLKCFNMDGLRHANLAPIFNCFPFLQELDLSHSIDLFDFKLKEVSLALPKLRKINLSGNNISDQSLFYLCKNCEFLEEIEMISVYHITVAGVASAIRERPGLRNLVDGVAVINEVVDFARRANRECLILKVDFEKAYDTVDWGFLEYMLKRVGFCTKWINWMKACVFGGNMSILVNGSPTEEISIERGLKQGDPLAPFLFLLVAEGFSGLMRNAVNSNSFKGFDLRSNGLVVSHLQYADDTLCIGEASVDNLWTLKALLRGFEMASGLRVNFAKSCLIGVNVGREFMDAACNFMNCREGALPFKYLGLPVGANPRRLSTWEPLLDCLNIRLNSWGNKYVSLGGRVVLLNAVLNAIPIFYLSFFKLPVKVWKKVVSIQRQFLWGGVKGGNKGLVVNLIDSLEGWEKVEEVDSWWWKLEEDGIFSVSSSYVSLESSLLPIEPLERTKKVVFELVWKSPAPSKVVAFSWQLLLNRIPTKDNLLSRRILAPVSLGRCEFCEQVAETATHLFLHCEWTFKVWSKVGGWLGINFITPQSLFQHFECWNGEIGRRKLRKGYWLIWHAVLWTIWKARNDRIFNNILKDFDKIVEVIKVISWNWANSRLKSPPCLYYEWCVWDFFLSRLLFWCVFGLLVSAVAAAGWCCLEQYYNSSSSFVLFWRCCRHRVFVLLVYFGVNNISSFKKKSLASSFGAMLFEMNFVVPKLEVLNLSRSATDDETLYAISKSCRGLLQLDLENCYAVTGKGVRQVVEKCTKLREINLRDCQNVADNVVSLMVLSRPSLRKITIPPFYHPSDHERELFLHHGCLVS